EARAPVSVSNPMIGDGIWTACAVWLNALKRCLRGREACFDEELVVSLIAIAGERSAEAGRFHAGCQEPTRFDERLLERHRRLESLCRHRPLARRIPSLR